ncbi:zinc finger protein piragua-like [Chironomus tepperi]|uniref:zinc finger protein piragua-like n=1 Tax=Chironomus tepperi TaxID=113505 RepID=UPI00391F80B6
MMQLNQICRLCLKEKTDNETVLVDIFSSLVNETGKVKLIEKILSTTGIKITRNDGRLPSKICHKCLVSIESFVEFRDEVRRSDEKLRILLNLDRNEEQNSQDADPEEQDEFEEIVKLDPNKVYESSEDETEQEMSPESSKPIITEPPIIQQEKIPPLKITSNTTKQRKEIFHCKYCDVVFSDSVSCTNHENFNHDPVNPYECNVCSLKFNQHQNLIIHIKAEHNTDKPFICVQCSKNFIRRSDLKKHTFVHAGIRMFSCNLCTKSFTRSTNLAKHKRTHLEVQKNFKCTLCPKAFISNVELSTHMEIHMNRNTFNCKYCNQAFTQRDELEVHQKTHITPMKSSQVTIQPQQPPQPAPIVFYNQNPIEQQQFVPQNQAPMNFYTENVEPNPPPPPAQPKIEYPIMNQLLTNFNNSVYKCEKCFEQFPTSQLLQNHQTLYHSKNFTCGICNSSYYKKKELDRHVITAHTDIRYNCSKCSKSFSRKDKLARHEKTHLIPAFYNCALCPAVFIRKHLLDLHSKIHLVPNQKVEDSGLINNLNLEQHPQMVEDQPMPTENYVPSLISPLKQRSPLDLSPVKHVDQPAVLYPMNLSINQQLNPINEPMDLSNDKQYDDCVSITKIEPPKIVIESDDEDDLKIIENNNHEKENDQKKQNAEIINHDFIPKTENLTSNEGTEGNVENIQNFMNATDQKEDAKMEDLTFHSMTSRLSDLDKMEPSKDLPMEILQSPDI